MHPIVSSPALFHPVTIVVKGILIRIHGILILFLRVVIASLRLNIPPAHTKVSLRIDQIIHATKPQNAERMTERMSFSMTDTTRQEIEANANNPAKSVSITQPEKHTAFRKAFDTIAFILFEF